MSSHFFGRAYTGKETNWHKKAAEVLGYKVLYDRDIITAAAENLQLKKKAASKRSIFKDPAVLQDRYTPAKARCIAAVKSVSG